MPGKNDTVIHNNNPMFSTTATLTKMLNTVHIHKDIKKYNTHDPV